MNSNIFISLYTVIMLSVIFFAASAVILRLRKNHGIRFSPLVYVLLMLSVVVPITSGHVILKLSLYHNANYDVRIVVNDDKSAEPERSEQHEIHEPDEIKIPSKVYRIMSASAGICLAAWFIMMSAKFGYGIANYFDSVRVLIRHSKVCHNGCAYDTFKSAVKKAGVKRKVVLRITKLDISPCTCGFTSPIVFISSSIVRDYSPEKLELIMIHELVHIKHFDILTKFAALFAEVYHFFSPLSKYIAQAVFEDCEYLCDSSVLAIVGDGRRAEYIGTILDIAERNLEGVSEPGAQYLSQYGSGLNSYWLMYRSETAENGANTQIFPKNPETAELFSHAVSSNNQTSAAGEKTASSSGSFILKRYERMKKRRNANKGSLYAFIIMLTAAGLNMIFMSSVNIVNSDNVGIDFLNPYWSRALCEYYGLDSPDEITTAHVNQIYSIELKISEKFEEFKAEYPEAADPDSYALVCVINEGKLPSPDGFSDAVSIKTAEQFSYSYAVDVLPDAICQDAAELMFPSDSKCRELLGLYQPIDAGTEAVKRFVTYTYSRMISDYGFAVTDGRDEILSGIEQLFEDNGTDYRGNGSLYEALTEMGRSSLSKNSPAAVYTPMYMLKFDTSREQKLDAVNLLYSSGSLDHMLYTSKELDLSDIGLFGGLKVLIFSDGLYTSQPGVYDNEIYAVIGKPPVS